VKGFKNGSRGSVFVDESTENIAAFDYLGPGLAGSVDHVRRKQGERSVRALAVVVSRVGADDVFEVAATKDQHPVETLDTDGAHEPLRIGVRLQAAESKSATAPLAGTPDPSEPSNSA
jgi:hypothetical protein